ncbi:hemolysin XhlA family protein [Paenibacillus donghaensis]|uniref:Hemolysin XhlA n=1 Tax=Paenibacillus donghaensis TaxID=414771 RepID=A0A2Z2KP33_9BACL|nr:hemolysin XhlA family protein [Paenibacillus donghaensis]ASA21941.1 hypothetical protein B9T62_14850 [Paenibacillus donghaensis]
MPDPQLETVQRLTRLETKIDSIEDKLDAMLDAKETANKALDSTKSAHLRIDRLDKLVNWVGTTIIGAVLLAIISLVIKSKG